MKLKKILIFLLTALMLPVFSGCDVGKIESGKLKIVCTVFPIYDWVREIAGDTADISLILKNGADMHSFNPSARNMIKIAESDLMIYIGGESDKWIDEALKLYDNKNRTEINLISVLGDSVKSYDYENCIDESHHHHNHTEETDEHIWLSLKNAELFAEYITEALSKKSPENKELYQKNYNSYRQKLIALDSEYKETVEQSKADTLIFADRFPFRYLTEDYGIKAFAAFAGCSAETEASFETIAFLSKKADELNLKTIIITETGNSKIAQTVIDSSEVKTRKILTLNSMQKIKQQDIDKGVNYLSVMTENLNILKEALN